MTGYVRKDTTNNIADGNVINANDLDNEFDGIQDAFNSTTGHNHDGTTGEGAPILAVGPTQDVVASATALTPKTTNTVDIGSGSLKFKDLYMAGNASIGGTLAVTGTTTLSGLTASTALALDASKNVVSVTNTGTGNNVLATSPTLVTPILGTPTSVTLTNATGLPLSTGVTGTLGTANGGTGLTSFTANGVVYASSTSALATGSALTFDGTNLTTPAAQLTFASNVSSLDAYNYDLKVMSVRAGGIGGKISLFTGTGTTVERYSIDKDGVAVWTIGSEQMRLTSTGLGIGTSSPSVKLDVSYADTAYNAGIRVKNTSNNLASQSKVYVVNDADQYFSLGRNSTVLGSQSVLFSTGAYPIDFYTDSTFRATIDSAGNLGLGVTPSAWSTSYKALEIGALGNSLIGFGASDVAISSGGYLSSSGWKYSATNSLGASFYEQYTGQHIWYNKAAVSHTAGDPITFTQAMTLDASGNLGVGTTSPAVKLEIGGTNPTINIGATNSASGAALSYNTSGNYFSINAVTQGVGYRNIALASDGGNVGIGTTSPSRKLSLDGGAGTQTWTGYQQAGTEKFVVGLDASGNPSIYGTQNAPMIFYTNNTERARIDSSGNLLVGTTATGFQDNQSVTVQGPAGYVICNHVTGTGSGAVFAGFGYGGSGIGSITQSGTTAVLYNVTSDQRLKENIADADSASVLIDSLQVRKFDWKADGNHQRYGFVAQELVTVAPEAVHQPADPEQMMAVDYSKLVPMLVKEIQSLRTRLADAGI